MPAYWFMYNMYALARNAQKYVDRDRRINPIQHIEYDYLAPDSISEVYNALRILKKYTAISLLQNSKELSDEELLQAGENILEDSNRALKDEIIIAKGFENSSRPTHIIKAKEGYHIYKRLINYYAAKMLLSYINEHHITSFDDERFEHIYGGDATQTWHNLGGQLMSQEEIDSLLNGIKTSNINSWEEIHQFYKKAADGYHLQKVRHAVAVMLQASWANHKSLTKEQFKNLLLEAISTKEWMFQNIYSSREKDYTSEFRKMVYDSELEMTEVLGKLEENVFIEQQRNALEEEKVVIEKTIAALNL
jgi:hypothetical protein